MRELLHSRSGHGKHHHRSEADHRETTKAAAWAVFQHHGGGGAHRHHLNGHNLRRVTRFKIEAQMKHAMAHHSASHMPTDTSHVNWDAGSTLFDSFELDSLCKQLGRSFHPATETPHPPNPSSSDETDHPEFHAYASPSPPNPNLVPRRYPRPPPQHSHPGLHDPTEDADAHHFQVGRGVSLVDGVLVPITVRGSSFRLTRNASGCGDGHANGTHKDDVVVKLDITGHGHAHAHGHGKLANMYRWWKEHHHHHKRHPSEKTNSDDDSASKDEFDDLHADDHHKSLKWKLTHLFHRTHHHGHDHHDVSLHMLHGTHNRVAPHDAVEKGHKGRGGHITAKLLDHLTHKHHHHHPHGDEGHKHHHEDHAGGHHGRAHGGKHNVSACQDLYIAKDVDLPSDHHKGQEDLDHHDHHHQDHHHHHHHLHLPHALKSGLRMVLPRALCRSVHLFHNKDDSDLEDSTGFDFHHQLDPHLISNNKGDLHHDTYNFGKDHDGSHIVHEEGEGHRELENHHDHHHQYHHHNRQEKHDYELTVQAIVRRVPRKSFEQMARRLSLDELNVKAPRNSLENFEERIRRSSGEDRRNSPQVGAFSEAKQKKQVEEDVNTELQLELEVNAPRTCQSMDDEMVT